MAFTYIGNNPDIAAEKGLLTKVITPPTYNVSVSDLNTLLLADAAGGPITINLPAVADVPDGFKIYIKKIDGSANTVTIDGDSSEEINGSTTVDINNEDDGIGITSRLATNDWFSFASSGSGAGTAGGGGLTDAGGSDSMPAGTYDIGINKADSLSLTSTALTGSYQYSGTGAAIVHGVIAANVDGTNDVEVSMAVNDFSAGTDFFQAKNIPVPDKSSTELLKNPIVLKQNDQLKFQANSANDVDLAIRYSEFDSNSDLFNAFYAAGTAAVGGYDTVYTEASTNGSVVESLILANSDGTDDVEVTLRIQDGVADPELIHSMNIPAKSSIEMAERPIVLLNGDALEVEVSNEDRLHISISRREI